MKYIELFGGIGGFSNGIEKAANDIKETGRCGQEKNVLKQGSRCISSKPNLRQYSSCVGYYELDKYSVQTYNKNFKTNYKPADITKLNTKDIKDHDLLCAGFPCQSFSIAGKRKGFEDTRGTMFFEICRILKDKRPPLLLLENVKGLLSHDEGRTFATILSSLSELGYGCEWQVLNSKHFGVPQNRERVFIIGHLGRECGQKVFPLGSINKDSSKELGKEKSEGYSTLTATYYKGGKGMHINQLNNPVHSTNRVYDTDGIARSIRAKAGGKGAKTGLYTIPVLTPERENKRQQGRRFKEDGEPMFTLTGQDIHGVMKENKIRRLTPIECERLQGFPDNWTKGVSDTQRYKQLGNAVTTNVIQAIIENIIKNSTTD